MNLFYAINIRSIKNVLLITVLAFFAAWILFINNQVYTPAVSTQNDFQAIYKGKEGVALTINIGWGDEKAEPIIDTLIENDVKAVTFFLAGSWAERHPDLVQKITKNGYEIGMLGYDYKDYTKLDEQEVRRDLNKAINVFDKLNIKDLKFMRAPTGNFNDSTIKIAQQFGLTYIHWSVDSKDWTNPGVEKIISTIKTTKNGDIVLMHGSDSAKQTAAALPDIIEHFKSKKLQLITVTELIANADSNSSEIK